MAHKAISKSIGEMLQEQVICETAMQSNSAQQKQTLVAPIKNPLTRHSYRCQRKKKHVLSIKKQKKIHTLSTYQPNQATVLTRSTRVSQAD